VSALPDAGCDGINFINRQTKMETAHRTPLRQHDGGLPIELWGLVLAWLPRTYRMIYRCVSRMWRACVVIRDAGPSNQNPSEYRPNPSNNLEAMITDIFDVVSCKISNTEFAPASASIRTHAIDRIVVEGHEALAVWMLSHGCPCGPSSMAAAAHVGSFRLMERILALKGKPVMKCTCAAAAAGAMRRDVLTWLLERRCPWDESCPNAAARSDDLATLRWAISNGCRFDREALWRVSAQSGGSMETLRWMADVMGMPVCAVAVAIEAAGRRNWDAIEIVLPGHETDGELLLALVKRLDHVALAQMARAGRILPEWLRSDSLVALSSHGMTQGKGGHDQEDANARGEDLRRTLAVLLDEFGVQWNDSYACRQARSIRALSEELDARGLSCSQDEEEAIVWMRRSTGRIFAGRRGGIGDSALGGHLRRSGFASPAPTPSRPSVTVHAHENGAEIFAALNMTMSVDVFLEMEAAAGEEEPPPGLIRISVCDNFGRVHILTLPPILGVIFAAVKGLLRVVGGDDARGFIGTSGWAELPQAALSLIAGALSDAYRVPFKRVCVSWNRACVNFERGTFALRREGPTPLRVFAEAGHVSLLLWYLAESRNPPPLVGPGLCRAAAEAGMWGAVRALREAGCPWSAAVCDLAAMANEEGVLRWARGSGCLWTASTAAWLAWNRNDSALRWAVDEEGCPVDEDSFIALAARGEKTLLSWLRTRTIASLNLDRCASAAIENGYGELGLAIVESAPSSSRRQFDRAPCAAARAGDIAAMDALMRSGCRFDEGVAAAAAKAGRVDALDWLARAEVAWPWGDSVVEMAARHGRIDVLRWALRKGCPKRPLALTLAAGASEVACVRWMLAHGWRFDYSASWLLLDTQDLLGGGSNKDICIERGVPTIARGV
jgi:hypothetical protein